MVRKDGGHQSFLFTSPSCSLVPSLWVKQTRTAITWHSANEPERGLSVSGDMCTVGVFLRVLVHFDLWSRTPHRVISLGIVAILDGAMERQRVSFSRWQKGVSEILVVHCLWFRRVRATGLIPQGQKLDQAHTHTHARAQSFFSSFCVPQMHTLPSLSAHYCPLSRPCPLKPEVTTGQGRYHSVRGTLKEERVPFRENVPLVSFFFFFFLSLHLCHSRYLTPECPLSKGSKTTCNGQCSKVFPRPPDAEFTITYALPLGFDILSFLCCNFAFWRPF